jgi:AraC-type transcriptional regulator N-terminus
MVAILSELTTGEGMRPTPIDGVRLGRADRGHARAPVLYEPSIYIVASGRKTAYLGDRKFVYDPNNYLVLSVPLPFECETEAGPEGPMHAAASKAEPQ